ncbi:MAG TPA: family 1 glycosylhydrolase [Vicinamibacterales bacterium]|nr:family 1 glycosylhydrolase [Vicinamibacterales bacterium]
MPDRPELWGGVECTVNRAGDVYRDQLALTGHDRRLDDLKRIRDLGIRTVRYPILWERTSRTGGDDWSWNDQRLLELRDLGIEPIVGLVHHGSGPPWTSLLDDSFISGLTDYAGRVVERYPWLRRFTIVNEPLTTARFSALYGLWYPHARSDRAFVRALLVQCLATRAAMAAIRERVTDAELIQTEDISRTTADRSAAAQAEFYQERRWLSFDLLMGYVTPDHALWPYLTAAGADEGLLDSLVQRPCPPSIIGLNYYVTSDRHLLETVDDFPVERRHFAGGAWFVDVEAVRTESGLAGHGEHLEAAWQRYRTPLAITEVHLDASGNDQARWLVEAWESATRAIARGIPVRAVTAWALFGSVDWNSLLTQSTGYYERGAFDVGSDLIRPRALCRVIRDLATKGATEDVVSGGAGWWQGPSAGKPRATKPPARIAICGGGTLARAFAKACQARGLEYRLLTRREVDAADRGDVSRMFDDVRPWAVINAAGYVQVDLAERETDRCWRDNASAPAILAEESAARGARLVTFSSDLVFDGQQSAPYIETDAVGPLSVYGGSKAAAEAAVTARLSSALIVRTAAFFGPDDAANFLVHALRQARRGERWRAARDLVVSPTYVPDLAEATLELLFDDAAGLWHLTSLTPITWADFAREAMRRFDLDPHLVRDCAAADMGLIARRPPFSALRSERGALMPSLESALDRFAQQVDSRLLVTS